LKQENKTTLRYINCVLTAIYVRLFSLDSVEKFLDTAYTIFLCYVGKFVWRNW